jgi:hypothetical protein
VLQGKRGIEKPQRHAIKEKESIIRERVQFKMGKIDYATRSSTSRPSYCNRA